MGNVLQKSTRGNLKSGFKSLKRRFKRKKGRQHEIVTIEYNASNSDSIQSQISPIGSDIYEKYERSMYSSQYLDESSQLSLIGIGITENPFYGSPSKSTSFSSTSSSFMTESLGENSVRGAEIIESICAPMLPPLDESYDGNEPLLMCLESEEADLNRMPSKGSEKRSPKQEQSRDVESSLMNEDEYLKELIEEFEDYGRLEETPKKQKMIQNFRALLYKKVQTKLSRQMELKQSSNAMTYPTPPKLKLPSAVKRKVRLIKITQSPFRSPGLKNLKQSDSPKQTSRGKVNTAISRFSPWKKETTNDTNQKWNKVPDEIKHTVNKQDSGMLSSKSENEKHSLQISPSPKSYQYDARNNHVNISACFSETSSPDIFDQIRESEVSGTISRSIADKDTERGEPRDLELFFNEVGDDDSESLDLLSRLNSNDGDGDGDGEGGSVLRQHERTRKLQTSKVTNEHHVEESRNSPEKGKIESNGFLMNSKSNTTALHESVIEDDEIVENIRNRLSSVRKLLTPRPKLRDENCVLNNLSFSEIANSVTACSPLKTTINGNNFTPVICNKNGNISRLRRSPMASSLICKRGKSPRQQQLKVVKKNTSPNKHSLKHKNFRNQEKATKMILVAGNPESTATSVKARILELNTKLKTAREIRQILHGDSAATSPKLLPQINDAGITFRKKKHTSAIMRDKGASRIERNKSIWTNYSLDGAGSLWKRKDDDTKELKDIGFDNCITGNHCISNDIALENEDKVCDDKEESQETSMESKENIFEIPGLQTSHSDVSPLTITSSETFRGRNEKIIDMLKTKLLPNDDGKETSCNDLAHNTESKKIVSPLNEEKKGDILEYEGLPKISEYDTSGVVADPMKSYAEQNSSPTSRNKESRRNQDQSDDLSDKENQPGSKYIQKQGQKGPPFGLVLSPVQRTPLQARKWRDLAAAAASKDKKRIAGKKKRKGKKTRKAMKNILNESRAS